MLYANDSRVGYALGNGDGAFAPGSRMRDRLQVADLNYDGYADLLVSAYHTMEFFAGGASGLNLTATPADKGPGVCVALADFNRDGSLDRHPAYPRATMRPPPTEYRGLRRGMPLCEPSGTGGGRPHPAGQQKQQPGKRKKREREDKAPPPAQGRYRFCQTST